MRGRFMQQLAPRYPRRSGSCSYSTYSNFLLSLYFGCTRAHASCAAQLFSRVRESSFEDLMSTVRDLMLHAFLPSAYVHDPSLTSFKHSCSNSYEILFLFPSLESKIPMTYHLIILFITYLSLSHNRFYKNKK